MDKPPKPLPECSEGTEAFQRFDALVGKLLSVPRAVLLKREAEYRAQVDANPHRRGPKRKTETKAGQHIVAKPKRQTDLPEIDKNWKKSDWLE